MPGQRHGRERGRGRAPRGPIVRTPGPGTARPGPAGPQGAWASRRRPTVGHAARADEARDGPGALEGVTVSLDAA